MAIRVPAPEPEEAVEEQRLVLEECTVVRWRGYTRSTFVACLADGTPVAESSGFKWRGDEVPAKDGPAGAAHAQLLRELEELGWTRTAEGEAWYDVRYGRLVPAPEEPEPEEAEEEIAPPPAAAAPLPPPLPVHVLREAPEPPPTPVEPVQRETYTPPARPEPEPVHAVAAAPEPATPTGHGSRPRRLAVVSVLGIVAALALGGYIAKSHDRKATRTVQLVSVAPKQTRTPAAHRAAQAPVAKPKPAPVAKAKPKPAAPAPRPMHLVIANVGHASWLEVRRGSATGPVLYSGLASPGVTLSYTGTHLWARFAAAANFRISVNGRPVALQGTVDQLFRP
jgi:hypothetical protein